MLGVADDVSGPDAIVGTDCLPMTAGDVGRLREERASEDWSARSAGRGGPAQTDPVALARARALLAAVPERGVAALATTETDDMLSGLMFGQTGDNDPPRVIYQHRQAPGGEPDRVLRVSEPLVLAIDRIFEIVEARLTHTPLNLPGGQQLAVADFPGPLVAGVTPGNILRHPHRARFRSLFNAFRHLGLVEQVGQGIDRMYREMLRFGRLPPRIVDNRDLVGVTFTADRPNMRIARFVASLPADEQDDLDVLLVISILRRRRSVTARDVSTEVQRSVDDTRNNYVDAWPTTSADSSNRAKAQSVESCRTTGCAVPFSQNSVLLSPTTAHRRPNAKERSSSTWSSMARSTTEPSRTCSTSTCTASAILRDLVSREILIRTSEQKRGHTVRYGPGVSFPRAKRS